MWCRRAKFRIAFPRKFLRYFPFSCDILYGWVKLRIKYRLLFVPKILDFVSWHHSYFYQHLANCMQSRSAETRRFPFIPLSISDWLIKKHHPIRETSKWRDSCKLAYRKLATNPWRFEPLSMVIVWIKVRRFYRDLSSQADPVRENWTWSYPYFS